MSNTCYLVTNDLPGAAGTDYDTHVGWGNAEGRILAEGPLAVPVYWLSLYEPSHLLMLDVAGDGERVMVPSLVAEMADARRRLEERRSALSGAFPEFQATWDRFAEVVRKDEARFIKVVVQELWDLDPDYIKPLLEAALRWFITRSDQDFDRLLEIACIEGYDRASLTFPRRDKSVPRASHLRGYAWLDKYWDNKADL